MTEINDIQRNDDLSEVEYKKQQIEQRIQKAQRALKKLLPLYEGRYHRYERVKGA